MLNAFKLLIMLLLSFDNAKVRTFLDLGKCLTSFNLIEICPILALNVLRLVAIHQIGLNALEWLKTALNAIVGHQILAAHNIKALSHHATNGKSKVAVAGTNFNASSIEENVLSKINAAVT